MDAVHVWLARTAAPRRDLARAVLAHELGVPGDALWIDTTCRLCGDPAHGKPRTDAGVCFSVSHTAGLTLVAVGPDELGVDVERHAGPGVLEGSELALAVPERAAVAAAPDRPAAFLALWTRKEAYLKGIGRGLVEDPATVRFAPEPAGDGWERIRHDGRATGWRVRSLDLPPGFAGALALAGPPRTVRCAAWPDGR